MRDHFVQRLQTMLWIEETLAADVLPLLRANAASTDLHYGLDRHQLETKQHALTVRTILTLLGERHDPQPTGDLAPPDLEHGDFGIAESIAKTEHLEIAAYTALRSLANALGEEEIAGRLQEILEQEQYALELAEKATAKFLAEHVTNAGA
jgi:ferritin-like metal-binding protein YciE